MICRKQSSLKKGVNIWQVVNENTSEQLPSYLAKICDVLYYTSREGPRLGRQLVTAVGSIPT